MMQNFEEQLFYRTSPVAASEIANAVDRFSIFEIYSILLFLTSPNLEMQ